MEFNPLEMCFGHESGGDLQQTADCYCFRLNHLPLKMLDIFVSGCPKLAFPSVEVKNMSDGLSTGNIPLVNCLIVLNLRVI